ncbi:MAG: pyridoxal 5'-phosphate synthase lyase subunit PdxS, partial [Archaeoglobaceae archaeon]|nr:pyridoxal 5'-phosphate synthase lyase subunit PdxS [Archaeoglobaceae archaeon]
LGEAVRRIWEGAAMIRTKGEAGTGNVVEAVKHMRLINHAIYILRTAPEEKIYEVAVKYASKYAELSKLVKEEMGISVDREIIYENFTLEEIAKGIYELLLEIRELGRLPVVNFAAGGIATPADAALMMRLGADGVFVGSGIFKSSNPAKFARAIVEAVEHYDKPEILVEVSKELGEAMKGVEISKLSETELLQRRGT